MMDFPDELNKSKFNPGESGEEPPKEEEKKEEEKKWTSLYIVLDN